MAKPGSLARALADALRKGATGAVVSTGKSPARSIWVRGNEALFVDSADPAERYTAILGRHGALTKTEILLVEEEFSGHGVTEENAIRASDIVPAADLPDYGRKVFEERLLAAFDVAGVTWEFVEGPIPEGTLEYPMPLTIAIFRGIRERYTPERLKLEFPVAADDHYTFERPDQAALGYRMSKVEDTLANALDGESPWAEVLGETKLATKDAHAALFAMALLGAVTYSGNEAPTRSAGSGAKPQTIGPAPAATGRAGEMVGLAAREPGEMLSIPPEAEADVVEKAFRSLVGKYDLGNAHQLPEADREAALALLDRATDACLVLTHPSSRTKYFEAAPWDRDVVAAGLALDLAAEKHYVKAGLFLAAGNCLAAEASLLPALRLSPRDSRFHLRMGIAIYLRAKARGSASAIPSGAARALEKAAAFDPENFEPWLYLGHVAMAAGDKARARGLYEHALELNPSSDEAKRAAMRAAEDR